MEGVVKSCKVLEAKGFTGNGDFYVKLELHKRKVPGIAGSVALYVFRKLSVK